MSIEKLNQIVKESMPVLFAVLASAWLGWFFIQPFNAKITDFPQYFAPARLICTGRASQSYDWVVVSAMQHETFPDMGDRVVPTYLPPPSLFWFLPLGFLSGSQAFTVWKLVQFFSLIGAILLLRNTFHLNRKALCWLIAGICISGPAFSATQLGQISMPILCALSALLYAVKHDKLPIAALALAILLLKPPEGLPLLVFIAGARRYKMLACTIAIVLFATLVVAGLTGTQGMSDYFNSLNSAVEKNQTFLMQSDLGPTVRGQMLRFTPDSKTLITVVSAVVMLVSWAFIFISGRKFANSEAWLEAGLLTALPLGLVTAFHFHSYDLTLLIPSLVLVMSGPLQEVAPPWLVLAGFLVVGTFVVPFYMYIHWDYLLKEHWLLNPHFFALAALALGLIYLAYRYPDKIQKDPAAAEASPSA
jgi:Glycosyltransferase family 87